MTCQETNHYETSSFAFKKKRKHRRHVKDKSSSAHYVFARANDKDLYLEPEKRERKETKQTYKLKKDKK
jgi:hypothetical protein